MAVTVISRPIGHKLSTTEIDALIYDNGGDAVVYVPGGHTLSDGDYVFIESNFDAYNGFKYVDSIAYDQFKIKESEGGAYVTFKQEADIILYVSELDHGFQSVHLPIVYELESDLWPVNQVEESYFPNVIDSFSNYNGYTKLNLQTALSNPVALDYINLISPNSSFTVNGPYQIIEVLQDWEIVINLAYDSTFNFSGYEVRTYPNNYFITVNVYGGLSSNHRWNSDKPFELLSTLKLIPDSNNKIKFSINEILKGQITTRNNLTLDTLPNNLDFYTQFYITYSESYDVSDGETITSQEYNLTGDSINFKGDAINSIYSFKSLNQSFASDYIDSTDSVSRWLTTQDIPIAITGYYFDLSFINQYNETDLIVTINKLLNDIVLATELLTYTNPGAGILRIEITPEDGYDKYCAQVSTTGRAGTPEITASITLPALSSGINNPGSGTDWIAGSSPNVSFPWLASDVKIVFSDIWSEDYTFIPGNSYSISVTWDGTNILALNITITFYIYILDSSNNILETYSVNVTTGAGRTDTITFIANSLATKYGCKIKFNKTAPTFGSDNTTVISINTITATTTSPAIPAIPPKNITEIICINVVSECNTFINDDLRLTEGGSFRELE